MRSVFLPFVAAAIAVPAAPVVVPAALTNALTSALPIAAAVVSTEARAQIQLPGAFKRTPAGTRLGPKGQPNSDSGERRVRGGGPPPVPKPVKLSAPTLKTVSGRNLVHNGRRGLMQFRRAGEGVEITRIKLAGDVISRHAATCSVEVPGGPFPVSEAGTVNGLKRYRAEVSACPFSFVVLDGAIIVTHRKASASTALGAGTCIFKDKDCRGYLAGVWGPHGRNLGRNKSDARRIEKERGAAARAARANFRALLRAARGDRPKVKEVAADQAGFSARREERCRDYLREYKHGFCASRITEARAVELGAKLNAYYKVIAQRRDEQKKKREAERSSRNKRR